MNILRKLLAAVLKMESLKQSAFVTMLSGINSVVSAYAFLLVARGIGVEGFGQFSVWLAAMLMGAKISDLGMNLVIQRHIAQAPRLDSKTVSWLRTSLYIKVVICLACTLLGGFLAVGIEDWRIVSLALVFLGITVLQDFFLVIFQGFSRFVLAAFLPLITSLVKLGLVAYLLWQTSISAYVAFLIWSISPVVVILFGIWWFMYNVGLGIPIYLGRDLTRLRSIGIWTSVGLLSAAVADQGDVLIVNNFLSDNATGLYNAAQKISSLFMMVTLSLQSPTSGLTPCLCAKIAANVPPSTELL